MTEMEKISNQSPPIIATNPSRLSNNTIGAKENSSLDEGPSVEKDKLPQDSDANARTMVVEPREVPQVRVAPIADNHLPVAPQQSASDQGTFRLPTPPPSSDDDSSAASETEPEEKVASKLQPPQPSKDSGSSIDVQEKVIFRLPTPPPSSDSDSDEDEEDVTDKGSEPVQNCDELIREKIEATSDTKETEISTLRSESFGKDTKEDFDDTQACRQDGHNCDQEKIVFHLPTPPPSSSSGISEAEDNDDSDTITIPETKVIERASLEDHGGNYRDTSESVLQKNNPQVFSVSDQLPSTNKYRDSAVINLESGVFKRIEARASVDETSVPAETTLGQKISLGFDDDTDIALSSLKFKSSPMPKTPRSEERRDVDDESEEDVLLASLRSKKKKSNSSKTKFLHETKVKGQCLRQGSHASDKRVLPRVSFGKSQIGETKKAQNQKNGGGGDACEEDVPLISLSNKKNTKPNLSKTIINDIPLIALRDSKNKTNTMQKGDGGCKTALSQKSRIEAIQVRELCVKQKPKNADDPEASNGFEPLISSTTKTEEETDFTLKAKAKGTKSQIQSIKGDLYVDTSYPLCVNKNETLASRTQNSPIDHKNVTCMVLKQSNDTSTGHTLDDRVLSSTQNETQSAIIDLTKQIEHPTKRRRIFETPDSQSIHFSADAASTQKHSQQEQMHTSNTGKIGNKCPLILETPDSKKMHSNLDLSFASTQDSVEKTDANCSKKERNFKRMRIESEDSNKTTSDMLVDTPQTATRVGVRRQSASDVLADTPTPATLSSIAMEAICIVCTSDDTTDDDPLILCDGCDQGFHKKCYSIDIDIESEEPWYCDSCIHRSGKGGSEKALAALTPANVVCTYCCQVDGALRCDGRVWYHPLCAAFASKITAASCNACSLVGAVRCNHNECSATAHPHCALAADWTIVRSLARDGQATEYSIFCPKHKDSARPLPSAQEVRIIRKEKKRNEDQCGLQRPKKLHKKSAKMSGKVTDATDRNLEATVLVGEQDFLLLDTDDEEESPQTKKQRIRERRREGLAKFVHEEAEIGSDQDKDDAEEEEEVRRIEEEEADSQDSFINDNDVLSQHFSQDNLGEIDPDAAAITDGRHFDEVRGGAAAGELNSHRALDALRERENRFKTPNFNRRMMRPFSDSSTTPSSAGGLGNMNFIRSVLEHHRRGGDCDQIEAEYQRLEREKEAATAAASSGAAVATTGAETISDTNHNRDSNACIDLTTSPDDGNSLGGRNTGGGGSSSSHNKQNIRSSSGNRNGNSINNGDNPDHRNANGGRATRISKQQAQPPKSGGLTADQLARIEANRQAAMRRRAEILAKKQQQQQQQQHR